MDKNNPACYECPKGRNGLHTWRKVLVKGEPDRAMCMECRLTLNSEQTADCFRDAS